MAGGEADGARDVTTQNEITMIGDQQLPPSRGEREAGDPARAGGGLRVLVIDDEAAIRTALRRFFTRLGWTVDDAADGAAALDKLVGAAASEYDAIISDLRMPGLSGIEFHDRLAAARPDLLSRIVFSTGDLSSREAADFVARTRCHVMEKPFELSRLRETVARVAASGGGGGGGGAAGG